MPLRTLHLGNTKSLTSLKSTKVFHRAKGNPWAGSQPTRWPPQGIQLWVEFWLYKYIPCFLITSCSFLTAHCMETIHWLPSSSTPGFIEMMKEILKTVLLHFIKPKLKSLEGKNVYWRSKRMQARKGKCRLNIVKKFQVECLVSWVSWEKWEKNYIT